MTPGRRVGWSSSGASDGRVSPASSRPPRRRRPAPGRRSRMTTNTSTASAAAPSATFEYAEAIAVTCSHLSPSA